eukprot:COSAG06_NODE_11765_length_1467_cov_17.210526_1_plen_186_part_10
MHARYTCDTMPRQLTTTIKLSAVYYDSRLPTIYYDNKLLSIMTADCLLSIMTAGCSWCLAAYRSASHLYLQCLLPAADRRGRGRLGRYRPAVVPAYTHNTPRIPSWYAPCLESVCCCSVFGTCVCSLSCAKTRVLPSRLAFPSLSVCLESVCCMCCLCLSVARSLEHLEGVRLCLQGAAGEVHQRR